MEYKGFHFTLFTILTVVLLLSSTFLPIAYAETSQDVEQTVYRVSKVVEELRGLNYKQVPPVHILESEEAVSGLGLSEWKEWELAQQEYEALYLVPEGVSAKELLEEFYGSALLGYYDARKNEIVVVGGAETPLDKGVLAHELTHALLDQYYPEAFETSYGLTDRDLALSAVLEGDAELVEDMFESGGYDCDLNFKTSSTSIPLGIIYLQLFPYFEGYNFVKRLKKVGGWEAVNRAYANPPESSEQVIHPSKYPYEKPLEVKVGEAGFREWKFLGEDVLGEASIFIMFWDKGLVSFQVSSQGRLTYKSALSDGLSLIHI